MKLNSKWKWGVASETRRGLLLGMGYTEEELDRPFVAVVNSWNEYNPGHVHLKEIAERVKQGIREAGGFPLEVMTTGICDGVVLIDPKYIELPSRNSIADQVEITVAGNFFDGMVLLSTCDSIVPGHLMGCARLDIPAIMVTGGYMPHRMHKGKDVNHMSGLNRVGMAESGEMPMDEFEDLMGNCFGVCGACDAMTTANSMCIVSEAMGMSMPGNASLCATSPKLRQLAYRAGKQIMYLINNGITARRIMTREAVKNAIKVDIAMAGSVNLLQHIPAIANEAGYDDIDWWQYFDEISNDIPLLCDTAPGGPYAMAEVDAAGGMTALMRELLPKLNGDCLTVTGKTLKENLAAFPVYDHEVIRSLDNPVSREPGMGVLYGNISPEGSFVKIAGVPKQLMTFKGPAVCFDSLEEAIDGLRAGKIKPGDACVLRYMGLKGRFGTTAFTFQEELKGHADLFNSCAIITDGRYSGATSGLSVGYVTPEASVGGVLALIRDGDEIAISIPDRKMDLLVPEEEIARRRAGFHWEFPMDKYPRYLNMFVQTIGSPSRGSIWDIHRNQSK